MAPCLVSLSTLLATLQLVTAAPAREKTYDYVIVGGGTGGLAIAARLAESTNTSVAVIEAGGFYQIDNGAGRLVLHGLQI